MGTCGTSWRDQNFWAKPIFVNSKGHEAEAHTQAYDI